MTADLGCGIIKEWWATSRPTEEEIDMINKLKGDLELYILDKFVEGADASKGMDQTDKLIMLVADKDYDDGPTHGLIIAHNTHILEEPLLTVLDDPDVDAVLYKNQRWYGSTFNGADGDVIDGRIFINRETRMALAWSYGEHYRDFIVKIDYEQYCEDAE